MRVDELVRVDFPYISTHPDNMINLGTCSPQNPVLPVTTVNTFTPTNLAAAKRKSDDARWRSQPSSGEVEGEQLLIGGDSRINDLMNDSLIQGKLAIFGISLGKV